jgi:redox-sensitive bicupin YhaK (pirin superfamily)
MQVRLYTPAEQAVGEFDGGKITEQKPIGFPGEGSAVRRIGPLFYWSWAFADEEGFIPSHPHQAFEIMTYVVNGEAEHGDSLGTKSVVGPGGVQVMQTGSGVYHNERFKGPDMEGFQIWFEPPFREALKRTPTYRQYDHHDFPRTEDENGSVKTVIGEGAPIELVADALMWDIEVRAGRSYRHSIPAGRTAAVLAIRGEGTLHSEGDEPVSFRNRDFLVLSADREEAVTLQNEADSTLRLIVIEVPTDPGYPVYPNI